MSHATSAAMTLQATINRLTADNQRLRRQNGALRDIALHTCAVTRVAECPHHEALMRKAFGREWQLLRVPDERG